MSAASLPERFHIHIDAESIDPRLSNSLLDDRGFSEKNFIRDGQRGSEYSPHIHITKKYPDRPTFDQDFDFIMSEVSNGVELEGYVEGEYVALNRQFSYRRCMSASKPPFKLILGSLPKDSFRQTELHLTVSRDKSDSSVLDTLFEMGFFCAYAPKDYGTAQVFTVQGSLRNIAEITPALIEFIERGGLAHVRLKEEQVVRWWVSSPSITLPPVIERIEYQTFVVPA